MMKRSFLVLMLAAILFAGIPTASIAANKVLTFAWEQGVADTSNPEFGGWRLLQSNSSGGSYIQEGNDIDFEVAKTEYQADFDIVVPDGQVTTKYYVMIAFNKTNQVSGYSNEVVAVLDFEAPPEPEIVEVFAPDAMTLRLIWIQSVTPDLTGWNLKRAAVAGGPYTVVHFFVFSEAADSYTADFEVEVAGGYFVLSAVDADGNESGDSNEITVEAPSAPFNLTVTVTAQ